MAGDLHCATANCLQYQKVEILMTPSSSSRLLTGNSADNYGSGGECYRCGSNSSIQGMQAMASSARAAQMSAGGARNASISSIPNNTTILGFFGNLQSQLGNPCVNLNVNGSRCGWSFDREATLQMDNCLVPKTSKQQQSHFHQWSPSFHASTAKSSSTCSRSIQPTFNVTHPTSGSTVSGTVQSEFVPTS